MYSKDIAAAVLEGPAGERMHMLGGRYRLLPAVCWRPAFQ